MPCLVLTLSTIRIHFFVGFCQVQNFTARYFICFLMLCSTIQRIALSEFGLIHYGTSIWISTILVRSLLM